MNAPDLSGHAFSALECPGHDNRRPISEHLTVLPLDDAQLRLLNGYQRNFPFCHAPFQKIACDLATDEISVLRLARESMARNAISRLGPVFAPHAVGASCLAALEVSSGRLDKVVAQLNRHVGVNHNYLREHPINLWFVASASDEERLAAVLEAIEQEANCGPLVRCPLIEEYRIDLGFDLINQDRPCRSRSFVERPQHLTTIQRRIVGTLQSGLPLTSHPYQTVAETLDINEWQLLDQLTRWQESGVIRRMGFVVRHHELGFNANAMVVWSVPEVLSHIVGQRLAHECGVTLCYRRQATPPRWPYNLYCMVHGRTRAQTQQCITRITATAGLQGFPQAVLFSTMRFKQSGATYANDPVPSHA